MSIISTGKTLKIHYLEGFKNDISKQNQKLSLCEVQKNDVAHLT